MISYHQDFKRHFKKCMNSTLWKTTSQECRQLNSSLDSSISRPHTSSPGYRYITVLMQKQNLAVSLSLWVTHGLEFALCRCDVLEMCMKTSFWSSKRSPSSQLISSACLQRAFFGWLSPSRYFPMYRVDRIRPDCARESRQLSHLHDESVHFNSCNLQLPQI